MAPPSGEKENDYDMLDSERNSYKIKSNDKKFRKSLQRFFKDNSRK